MNRIHVLHLVDTLWAGGAERVAVDLVNHLPRDRFAPHLCTTRRDGPLEPLVAADVGRLRLARTRRFDGRALRRLVAFIREHDIRILHARTPLCGARRGDHRMRQAVLARARRRVASDARAALRTSAYRGVAGWSGQRVARGGAQRGFPLRGRVRYVPIS